MAILFGFFNLQFSIQTNDYFNFPISNVKPNERSGNIGCPIVTLEDSPALEIERFSSEFDNEAPTNEDLGREATTWKEEVTFNFSNFVKLYKENST